MFSRTLDWAENNWCNIISSITGLAVAWLGASEYSWQKDSLYRAGSIVLLTAATGILQTIQKHKEAIQRQRSNESLALAMPPIIRNYVIGIYENMGLGTEERITLYLHNENYFLPCARFSRNSNFKGIKRPYYRNDRGVIEKVWSLGWYFDNKFPDPANGSGYYEYCRDTYKYCKKDVDSLSMKARFYCGIRIEDSLHRDSYAMIIIESMNPNYMTETEAKKQLTREAKILVPLLENKIVRDTIPNQSIVGKEEGF